MADQIYLSFDVVIPEDVDIEEKFSEIFYWAMDQFKDAVVKGRPRWRDDILIIEGWFANEDDAALFKLFWFNV